ncbi:hypothetical protein [Thiomicrorhabdus cannonii]|uniref:hypothetical protein n=1 Tax=Thiomicrorhabdus cannonii TaxID=2748011 RepID=UPI0015BAB53D|nr:hypothetical protein [Thiomicrorhabdus cannonii]
MFSKLKSFFGIGQQKALDDWHTQLTSQNESVNLDTHPQCPKYLSLEVTDFHHPNENRGVFTVEAAELLQWFIKRGRQSDFETTFRQWLGNADSGNEETYALSANTIHKLNLQFFVDDALEYGHAIKAHCPVCDQERTNDELKLIQESCSGWVYRMVDCQCGNRLASYQVMHLMLRAGAEMPKSATRVVKDFGNVNT